jgi:hypothetical protein
MGEQLMPNEHNFRQYAERARKANGTPLVKVYYWFSRDIPGGSEDWFFANGIPGHEFGWAYRIEILALPSSRDKWGVQVESYSLSLFGARSEALGKLPREIHPWTEHILDMDLHGLWGVTSDFHTALAFENLHGSDWLAEQIMSTELLSQRLKDSE